MAFALISNKGGGLIGLDGGTLISVDHARLIGLDGGTLKSLAAVSYADANAKVDYRIGKSRAVKKASGRGRIIFQKR